MSRTPLVALIGLPNSGKSTILNKLTGTRNAIVAKEAHTTRDLNYGEDFWEGMYIRFVDTGGLVPKSEDKIQREVQVRSWAGIAEADYLLWVIDRKQDIDTIPLKIMQEVWKTGKPFMICINKVDDPNLDVDEVDYVHLGGEGLINVSAQTGYNLGFLMDQLVEKLLSKGFQKAQIQIQEEVAPKRRDRKKPRLVEPDGNGRYIVRDEEGIFTSVTEDQVYKLQNPDNNDEKDPEDMIQNLILDFQGVLYRGGVDEDLIQLLRYLRAKDYKLYFLTDLNLKDLQAKFETEFKDYIYLFEAGATPETLDGSTKSDSNTYQSFLDKFELEAKQTLFIDDTIENITVAQKFDINSYLFDPKNKYIQDILGILELDKKDFEDPKILFLGKPNVGKSSLFNAMIGSEQQIVTEIAGTTMSVNEQKLARIDNKPIKNIIFDFYDVIFQPKTEVIFEYFIEKLGINREDKGFYDMLDQVTNQELSHEEIIQILSKNYNFDLDTWDLVHQYCSSKIQADPEVFDFMKSLKDQGYKLYYLTNIESSFEDRSQDPVFKLFEGGIASYQVGLRKPDPKIYQMLLDKYNIRANQSIFIDDRELNLEGAKKVGLKTICFKKGETDLYADFHRIKAWQEYKSHKSYKILDSVGVRKPGQRTFGAETFATYRTIQTAYEADIICLVLDGSVSVSHQDQVVAGIVKEAKKGVVIIANKMDIVSPKARAKWEIRLKDKFQFLKTSPVVWTSAVENLGLEEVWRKIDLSILNRSKEIDRVKLRKLFNYIIKKKPPTKIRTKKKAILYDLLYTQNNPPTFEILIKDKKTVHWSFVRFVENLIRRNFNFEATEIVVKLTEIDKKKVLSY